MLYFFLFYLNFQRSVCIKHYPGRVPKALEQTAHACILAKTLTGKYLTTIGQIMFVDKNMY